ncbi:hypothetical protein Hanom_Chr11g00994051 [Helianthus anomalus]
MKRTENQPDPTLFYMKNWNRSKYLGTWVRVGLGIFSVRCSVIFGPDLNLLTSIRHNVQLFSCSSS